MDANGTVVTGISGTNSYQRAFIWDEEQGTRRVLDEVRTRGLELPVDLELTHAEFLSDDGRINCRSVFGGEYAFVLAGHLAGLPIRGPTMNYRAYSRERRNGKSDGLEVNGRPVPMRKSYVPAPLVI